MCRNLFDLARFLLIYWYLILCRTHVLSGMTKWKVLCENILLFVTGYHLSQYFRIFIILPHNSGNYSITTWESKGKKKCLWLSLEVLIKLTRIYGFGLCIENSPRFFFSLSQNMRTWKQMTFLKKSWGRCRQI